MIKKILSNVSNKVKAIYLLWVLFNLFLFLSNTTQMDGNKFRKVISPIVSFPPVENYHTKVFFPLTSPDIFDMKYVAFYDITEFLFYVLSPIFIYVIIKLYTTKEKLNE